MVDPDRQFEHIDRANLAAVVPMEGFKVIQQIFEIVCEKFRVALDNADPANHADVIAKHTLRKAAVMTYQEVVNRINEEITLYRNSAKASDEPVDPTEGMIDFGEIAEQVENLPNFLGGE